MKRDLELIRKMLLAVENHPAGFAPSLKIEGYAEAQIGYHAYLLVNAGLARGCDVTSMDADGPQWQVGSLTWAGHEFIEAARDDTRWKRAKALVAERGGSVTLDVLKALLTSLMKGALGLS